MKRYTVHFTVHFTDMYHSANTLLYCTDMYGYEYWIVLYRHVLLHKYCIVYNIHRQSTLFTLNCIELYTVQLYLETSTVLYCTHIHVQRQVLYCTVQTFYSPKIDYLQFGVFLIVICGCI